jgi:hypothetical protein
MDDNVNKATKERKKERRTDRQTKDESFDLAGG